MAGCGLPRGTLLDLVWESDFLAPHNEPFEALLEGQPAKVYNIKWRKATDEEQEGGDEQSMDHKA